ncbi:hypothetical protein [Curtobacterium luteum]|uniref:Uncharacterized protein n=1 Tax=Curtobacterium luteum TaxID=33881 RepID=A0A175S132_9MICO|nr:hypothetical protein [Curtobacterium luteum]KTR08830.1 hypothetical protein NS184_04735 [Curtobacterium luteum]
MKLFTITQARSTLIAATTAALFGSMLVASPASASATSPAATTAITETTVQALFDATDRIEDRFDGALARRAGVDAATVDSYATGFAATGGIVQNAAVDPDQA